MNAKIHDSPSCIFRVEYKGTGVGYSSSLEDSSSDTRTVKSVGADSQSNELDATWYARWQLFSRSEADLHGVMLAQASACVQQSGARVEPMILKELR